MPATSRRLLAVGTTFGTLVLGILASPTVGAANPQATPACPAAESLVPAAHWHLRTLAPGVQLYEGTTHDKEGHGLVKMHVMRVDLTQPGVSIRPLMHSVAQRAPLTALARGHKNLVAATNTGYFDYVTGAPTEPLIVRGKPLVASARPRKVLGLDAAGTLQSGSVALAAKVIVGGRSHKVDGVNTVEPGGIVAFTTSWGATPIPIDSASIARPVVSQRLGIAVPPTGASTAAPSDGYELVARRRAGNWLAQQPSGVPVQLPLEITTTAPRPFFQAYGVGTAIVASRVARTGLSCDSAGTPQPARTAIGSADHGATLVIAEVEDHPNTTVHGLDEDQMGKFMQQLGVDDAWDFDGSGSTELLARMPGTDSLSLRTYPADGAERPMPVGLGITYTRARESQ